jgi:hypothetical protein
MATATPTEDPVHHGEATRWGGWEWREPRRGDHFRTCSYCGSINPEDLAAEIGPQGRCAGCGATGWEAHFRNTIDLAVRHGIDGGLLALEDLSDDERRRYEVPEHPYDPGTPYASWADRKYGWPHKFYVENLRPRDPSLLHCFSHFSGTEKPAGSLEYVAAADLTREQKKILESDGMGPRDEGYSGWYAFRPRDHLFAKFYTAHLADPRVPAEAREKIETASGVRFHFTGDGRVSWHGTLAPCDEPHPPSPEVTGGSDGDQQVAGS